MTKYMTKQQREAISNRLILTFGILLCGSLVMLYVYNFISAGYMRETQNVIGVLAVIFAVLAVVSVVLGKIKNKKFMRPFPTFLGAFIGGAIVFLPRLIPAFQAKTAVILVFVLMLVYLIVMAIITGIILKLHPEQPKEKKVVHAKKKNKRK